MPSLFGILALLVIALIATLFTIWALPFVGIAAIALIVYLVAARKHDSSVATIERGRRTEPTGTPRKASAGVETSNERVGQG